ncbi:MAG TPA: tRNA (N(6)-L-threonylcarbamoyladenosine(37)-C(2))-methylthiotransferase MtaB [Dehalococcoidia bacterium]|nr:tRNA (N(6)-L-threonylcarbamoyladenosine(37)-C(2))-methylthiotransferase MtaB [Dehalococcoidia bacterium]
MPFVAIHTQGCKLNQADSSQLAWQFLAAGYQLVDSATDADVFVLNTCTITATADAKARQALRAARRKNPNAIIVATGCYSQRAARELDQLDAVSLVVGNTEKHDLVSLVSAFGQATHQPASGGRIPVGQTLPTRKPASRNFGRVRAMIKIQEGCNQVCAYCIVPRVRGRERSIPPDSLIQQVNQHVSEGGQEVVLTGTQLGTYGFDLPATNLSNLLERLLKETGVARLRVSSLQAQEITPELLKLWGNHRLCPHFHVPLQNGCDTILKAMRRRYDTAQFVRTAKLIRHTVPHAAITTDIIVGFPGEGEAEFRESLRFADSIAFSDMHVFPYSVRPGTSAAFLENQVPAPSKGERMREMLDMSRRNFLAFREQQSGQVRPVLWQASRKRQGETWWSGLTDNYVRVSASSEQNLGNTITLACLGEMEADSVRAEVR